MRQVLVLLVLVTITPTASLQAEPTHTLIATPTTVSRREPHGELDRP